MDAMTKKDNHGLIRTYIEGLNRGFVATHVKAMRASKGGLKTILLKLKGNSGQGTVEYAILVGVLVVIATAAIAVFAPRIQELWNAISDGISSL